MTHYSTFKCPHCKETIGVISGESTNSKPRLAFTHFHYVIRQPNTEPLFFQCPVENLQPRIGKWGTLKLDATQLSDIPHDGKFITVAEAMLILNNELFEKGNE